MIRVIVVKVEWYGFTLPECNQKGGHGTANSVDPDQTAPQGAVWSGSTLFAHTYLSQYLQLLRYITFCGFYRCINDKFAVESLFGYLYA